MKQLEQIYIQYPTQEFKHLIEDVVEHLETNFSNWLGEYLSPYIGSKYYTGSLWWKKWHQVSTITEARDYLENYDSHEYYWYKLNCVTYCEIIDEYKELLRMLENMNQHIVSISFEELKKIHKILGKTYELLD